MSTSISAALLNVIQQELPSATAGELKKYLHQAERDKDDLASAQKALIAANSKVSELMIEMQQLKHLEGRLNAIVAEESNLVARQAKLGYEEKLNDLRIDAERTKSQNMFEVLRLVFRSAPIGHAFTKTADETNQVPVSFGGGGITTGFETRKKTENTQVTEIRE